MESGAPEAKPDIMALMEIPEKPYAKYTPEEIEKLARIAWAMKNNQIQIPSEFQPRMQRFVKESEEFWEEITDQEKRFH